MLLSLILTLQGLHGIERNGAWKRKDEEDCQLYMRGTNSVESFSEVQAREQSGNPNQYVLPVYVLLNFG